MDAPELLRAALQHFTGAQFLSGPEQRRLQDAKLRFLLHHAAQNVRLYRDLYREHGVSVGDIGSAEDLWRLPSVAKEDYLRAGPRGYVDEGHELEKLTTRMTSGSLGRGLTIYATGEEAVRTRASMWSGWLGRGVTRDDRLFMMGSPHLARPWPAIRSEFAPVRMSGEEILDRFRALQPTVIIGLIECIAMLAHDVQRHDLPERHGVRKIFSFGQTLSPQLRQMLQAGFDAEIINLYGSTETSWMGYECEEHAGLHLHPERTVVQIARLDDPDQAAPPGELGQIIVTSLMRRINPFIRYRLNDVAALDHTPCPCGRSAPRLQSVEGRVHDFLVSTSGRWVAPASLFIGLGFGRKTIVDHRVVQETRNRVRISIVPGAGFDDAERERIGQLVRQHLGEVAVTIDLVDEIPREASGKRRRIFRAFDLESAT